MRTQARKTSTEDDGESVFVSMTDMTVGFLFIVMILLAFFASQFKNTDYVPKVDYTSLLEKFQKASSTRDRLILLNAWQTLRIAQLEALLIDREYKLYEVTEQRNYLLTLTTKQAGEIAELKRTKSDPLEIYMGQVAAARRTILVWIRDGLKLDFPDLQVQLSEQNDALRFQGDGLFVQGSAIFTPGTAEMVKRIAQRLNEVLPCYTFGRPPTSYKACNPNFAVVEAVQIEGHTDSTGTHKVNINLSAERATTTFGLMTETTPMLREYKNLQGQSVMSFAGYGPDRPIKLNDSPAGQAANRRIDLRFIMLTPQTGTQLEDIRQRFINFGLARP